MIETITTPSVDSQRVLSHREVYQVEKINEIIDVVNELKETVDVLLGDRAIHEESIGLLHIKIKSLETKQPTDQWPQKGHCKTHDEAYNISICLPSKNN